VLRYQAGILTSRVPGLPLPDPEFVHEMRVASRRLRAALRTFRSVLRSDEAARLRSAATTAARLLGTVRDADVQAARLRRLPGRSSAPIRVLCDGLLRRERRRRSRALAVARRRLDAAWVLRFSGVLARVLRRLEREHGPAGGRDASFSRLWRPAQRSLRRVLRRVARQETCLSRMTSGEQHDLRVALKRVRYAAECLEPVIGRRVFGLLRACVRLQGFLGDAHDADLLAARLGRATGPGAAARAALRRSLSDLRRRRIKAADRAWPGFCRRSKAVLRRLA
jgi:CHAD domain-containing protein